MSEKITASVLNSFSPEIVDNYERYTDEIVRFGEAVPEYLAANYLNPNEVLFAGYNDTTEKSEGTEHWEAGANHNTTSETYRALHHRRASVMTLNSRESTGPLTP